MAFLNYQATNNASGTLLAGISASATSAILSSGQGALFPSVFPFLAKFEQFDSQGRVIKREIVKVTNRISDTLTIVRSAGSCPSTYSSTAQTSTAFSFDPLDSVSLTITAEQLKDTQDEVTRLGTAKLDKAWALRTGLTPSRVTVVDASGNETYVAPWTSGQFLANDLTFKSPSISESVFGDGSDGAVNGAITITGSNDSVVVRNYSSFAPWANTVTITPTGCVTIIKVKWDCDLTGTTLNFSGKWKPGGNGWTGGLWTGGFSGTGGGVGWILDLMKPVNTYPTWGGGWNGTSPGGGGGGGGGWASIFANGTNWIVGWNGAGSVAGWTAGTGWLNSDKIATLSYINAFGYLPLFVAQGGGGGGGGGSTNWANGGAGGAGGGTVIFIVGWNTTFASTTVNCNWTNGTNGWPILNIIWGSGGGGGGGGGGMFLFFYNGTLTWTVTPNVNGWNAGSGGSLSGSSSGTGSAGWAGATGMYAIQKLVI